MISVEECRKILGDTDLTDAQIIELRNALYGLSESVLDKHFQLLEEESA